MGRGRLRVPTTQCAYPSGRRRPVLTIAVQVAGSCAQHEVSRPGRAPRRPSPRGDELPARSRAARRGVARRDVGGVRRHREAQADAKPDRGADRRQGLLADVRLPDGGSGDPLPAAQARSRQRRDRRLGRERRPRARARPSAGPALHDVRLGRAERRRRRGRGGDLQAAGAPRPATQDDRDAERDPRRHDAAARRQLHRAAARHLAGRRRSLRPGEDPLPRRRARRRRAVRGRGAGASQARHPDLGDDGLVRHRRRRAAARRPPHAAPRRAGPRGEPRAEVGVADRPHPLPGARSRPGRDVPRRALRDPRDLPGADAPLAARRPLGNRAARHAAAEGTGGAGTVRPPGRGQRARAAGNGRRPGGGRRERRRAGRCGRRQRRARRVVPRHDPCRAGRRACGVGGRARRARALSAARPQPLAARRRRSRRARRLRRRRRAAPALALLPRVRDAGLYPAAAPRRHRKRHRQSAPPALRSRRRARAVARVDDPSW